MNIIKDGIVLDVTEKAFEVVYKAQGYVPYNSETVRAKVVEAQIDYDSLTKAEIIKQLEKKEVEHDPKALKEDLLEILRSEG